jgi:hypothetical protein
LASFSLSLPLAISLAPDPLLPRTPSDYLGALSLGGSTYGASVPATRLVTSLVGSLPVSRSLPLSLPLEVSPSQTVSLSLSFPFLSLSSASFTMPIGTILRRHYLPPRLQWYQLPVAPLLKIPLTLS